VAEAIFRVKDIKGGVDFEVKFTPEQDSNSPAHQLVMKFIESAGLEMVNAENQPTKDK
jgi:hypothetical protein